jgi:transcriptional regulator with PAS, ATPase and Fis domain
MKKKALSYYLDLMKSAQDKQDWSKAKRYGETALKKLSSLSHSYFDRYLLYSNLGLAYFKLSKPSRSIDMFHTAYLIASKHHLAPQWIAHSRHFLGSNFIWINSFNQAISQFEIVEEYYQKYGDGVFPMDKTRHFVALVSLGKCYVFKDKLEKVQEIIQEQLPYYQNVVDDYKFGLYYQLNGEYLIKRKEYGQARQAFQKYVTINEQLNYFYQVCSGKIYLATVDLLEKQLDSAINILESLLNNNQYLKYNDLICASRLLLSKCYILNSLPDKADAMEKRLKPLLKKLDITWLYETIREFEQLFRQLQDIYKSQSFFHIPEFITNTLNQHYESFKYAIIGKSKEMMEIYNRIKKIAPTDLPILIQGETGTGKELIAYAIHQNSLRKGKRWLALNCGAVPETLLENTLFGHAKGSFTDAKEDKKGYIELASDGTLFLDEIGDMSPNMQQKLLRVMDEKLIWRLGAQKPVPVNTRFIFASNQNIEDLVKQKRFRLDLFHRINTIIITLPPLRNRKEDIPLLINHFLVKYTTDKTLNTQRSTLNAGRITPDALALLQVYPWSGNVRELENEIKRICTLYPRLTDGQATAKTITEEMLSETIRNYKNSVIVLPSSLTEIKKQASDDIERKIIIEELKKSNGNITHTARHLGCRRQYLQRKIKQLKIEVSMAFVTKK